MEIVLENADHKIDEVVVTALGMKRDRKGAGLCRPGPERQRTEQGGVPPASPTPCRAKLSGVEIVPSSGMPGASSQVVHPGSPLLYRQQHPALCGRRHAHSSRPPDFSTGQSVSGHRYCRPLHRHRPQRHREHQRAQGAGRRPPSTASGPRTVWVVITTKSGRGLSIGRPHVTFTTNLSAETLSRRPAGAEAVGPGLLQRLAAGPTVRPHLVDELGPPHRCSARRPPPMAATVATALEQLRHLGGPKASTMCPQLAQAGRKSLGSPRRLRQHRRLLPHGGSPSTPRSTSASGSRRVTTRSVSAPPNRTA